jgi:hypothetical protein
MKKLSKKTGITIFTALMVILGAIIILYRNPLADPVDEMLKKSIACVLIAAAIAAFIKLYENEVIPATLQGLCGSVYTQVSDVEDETNGLWTYDRQALKVTPDKLLPIAEKLYENIEK